MTRYALLALAALTCAGCGTRHEPLDETGAMERGARIADATFQVLAARLQQATAAEGIHGAVDVCSRSALPIVDSLSRHLGVRIRRVSHRVRNPADRPDAEEGRVLAGYLHQLELGSRPEELRPLVHAAGDSIHFHRPILLAMPLCLSCHGLPGTDIDSLTLAAIQARYPQDAATGHTLGDLRGMWSIRWAR